MSDSLRPHGLYSPQNSPGQNPGVGSLSLLQGAFSTQGLNPGLLQCGRPGFGPWVRKIPWRRERLPTPGFWPGELHGLYSPCSHKESDTTSNFRFHFSIYSCYLELSCLSVCLFHFNLLPLECKLREVRNLACLVHCYIPSTQTILSVFKIFVNE